MEAVVTAWDDIDWERLQTRIETEINALGQRQDDSEERRKRLVEESNSYRQNTNKESRKPAIPLIKAFQQEFDGLLARSQYAETAFIDICSQITNLPDPKTLLKGAEAWKSDADKTKRAVEERESLKKKLQETQLELAELQNKDAELRQLKNTLVKKEFEQGKYLEDSLEEAEKRIRDEFISQLEEMNLKSEKIKAENEILEKKVNEMEAKNRETQRKLDVAKMANDQNEELENEQLAIALKDLNDANHRIVTLEQRLSELDAEMSQNNETSLKNGNGLADISAIGELMHEKDEQISKLCNEINQIEEKHEKELKFWKDKVSSLEREQKVQRGHVEDLKAQLDTRSDYEAIKKELRLLREIEFGSTAAERSETFGESVESLDRLLADKNRRLQNENASLRVLNDTYKASIEENQRETANLRQRAESAEKLSAKLENDLASALGGGALRETDQMSTLDMLRTSTGADESSKTRNQEENIRAEASLVPILTSQRNRLHEKVTQLEELLAIEKTKQMTVSTEAEKVRDDNKKLYEKVRFLQGGANKSSAVEIEQDIFDGNNFRKFANSDRNRSLQLHDRATLTVGRAILSSSKSRMIFLVYLLILHLLIMLVLYKFAYDQATLRDQETECDYKFMQHMKSHTDH